MTSPSNCIKSTLLAVDTSTSHMSVALTRDGELLGELNSNAEKNHSIHLLPHIQELLTSAGYHPRDLGAFAVGVGPGSYTGVRIGVTVAKTFAWAHGMAVISVSSLAAMALGGLEAYLRGEVPDEEKSSLSHHSAVDSEMTEIAAGKTPPALAFVQKKSGTTWVIPMIEARRGQAFTGLYQVAEHQWSCLVPDAIRLMSTWADELLERAQSCQGASKPELIVFVGETKLHREVLQSFFERWGGRSVELVHELRARHIAELGQVLWQAGHVAEPHGLVPNYTQLTEAEVNLLAQKSTHTTGASS